MPPTVHLFARYPTPGEAKTRLIPSLGAEGAAALHRRFVERAIATVAAAGLPLVVRTTGAPDSAFAAWLGDGVARVEQGEGDLGRRMAAVPAPAILLGADVPDLRPRHLTAAADALCRVDVAIGPAVDGGYYLLGLARPAPALFEQMAWGTDAVFAETVRRLEARSVSYERLEPLHDCDRPADLARWPELTA